MILQLLKQVGCRLQIGKFRLPTRENYRYINIRTSSDLFYSDLLCMRMVWFNAKCRVVDICSVHNDQQRIFMAITIHRSLGGSALGVATVINLVIRLTMISRIILLVNQVSGITGINPLSYLHSMWVSEYAIPTDGQSCPMCFNEIIIIIIGCHKISHGCWDLYYMGVY